MIRAVAKACWTWAYYLVSFNWLTGPIFDKELRVTGRRFRYYALRSGYLTMLALLLAMVWASEVRYSSSGISQASRMARAGQIIISFIVWFQFCAIQLVALVALSNAISDEIYHKTLGVLMTTPITSFQIVMGKLGSKLLQLILLMAISLPVLAIVRVFGGVPWDYLISSLCITLTTVLLVAAVCMFYSIFNKKFYVVITSTVLSFGIVFVMMPLLALMIWHTLDFRRTIAGTRMVSGISLFNPYLAMAVNTLKITEPRAAARIAFSWPLHCAIMLAAAAIVIALSVILVRRAALHQAIGATTTDTSPRRTRPLAAVAFLIVTLLLVAAQFLFESFWSGSRHGYSRRTGARAIGLLIAFVLLQFCVFQFLAVLLPFLRHKKASAARITADSTWPRILSGRDIFFTIFDTLARVLLIAAVTLPLFAMLRRMVDIPLDRVIPCLCSAVAAAFFTAAWIMLLLVVVRSIWRWITVVGVLFAVLPVLVCLLNLDTTSHTLAARAAFYANPYTQFVIHLVRLLVPDAFNVGVLFAWYVHCLITLAGAALITLAAMIFAVRTLRSAVPVFSDSVKSDSTELRRSLVRRVSAMPVFWKELRAPLIKKGKIAAIVAGAIALFALFLTYDLCAAENALEDNDVQTFYVIVFSSLGFLVTITLPATCITTEKEARTWPILLATSLGDYHIIFGKFL